MIPSDVHDNGVWRGCRFWLMAALVLGAAVARAADPATRPALHPPLIRLDASQPIAADPKVPCTMAVDLPPGSPSGQTGPWQGLVRVRGATSQAYPKKSYLVAFEQPVALLDLPKRNQWILNAAYIDRSLMRHKLAYDLFLSLSEPDRPRHAAASRFVEVHLNGKYNGVYLLQQRIDRDVLGLAPFSKDDPAHACLYKAFNHDAGFADAGHSGYEQEEPDPLTAGEYWGPMDTLRAVIHGDAATFNDPQKGIASHLDLDNVIDFHLLVLVTGNADGITKNFYLARHRPETGKPAPMFFVPWDYDGTFGRNWDSSPLRPAFWLSNPLMDRLMHAPGYHDRFVERWRQLRQKQFSPDAIIRMIDDNARVLGPAATRNAERWPTDRPPYRDRLSCDQDIAQMKQWIVQRIQWLDQTVEKSSRPRR